MASHKPKNSISQGVEKGTEDLRREDRDDGISGDPPEFNTAFSENSLIAFGFWNVCNALAAESIHWNENPIR